MWPHDHLMLCWCHVCLTNTAWHWTVYLVGRGEGQRFQNEVESGFTAPPQSLRNATFFVLVVMYIMYVLCNGCNMGVQLQIPQMSVSQLVELEGSNSLPPSNDSCTRLHAFCWCTACICCRPVYLYIMTTAFHTLWSNIRLC